MPSAEKQLEFAARWLDRAKADLAAARVILGRGPDLEPWVAAYHAQQAAEKSVKALLIARSIEPDRKHDLVELSERLPGGLDCGASTEELARLSKYSSEVRYPGPLEQPHEPTWPEAEAAVEVSARVLDAATVQIRGR